MTIKSVQIILISLLIGCSDDKAKQAFSAVDRSEINQIVEAVIRQDSLPFYNTSDTSLIPLSTKLRKIYVTAQDTLAEIPPPVDRQRIPVYKLLNTLVKGERFFDWSDTAYFYFQNTLADTFTLGKAVMGEIMTTELASTNSTVDMRTNIRYYDWTIPILSKNQTRAYIELTINCVECGGATAFYLEKIKGKWTVVGWNKLWMN
jgi:hypothetical protein